MSTPKAASSRPDDFDLVSYLNLKLAALGEPIGDDEPDGGFLEIAGPLLRNCFRKDELLGWPLCPADSRIQTFLDDYLVDADAKVPRLPARTLVLDKAGLARVASLPRSSDCFASPYLTSYRIAQGLLHNPKSDRRTTKGVFHVADGGLPVPMDKKAVPKKTFALLLSAALNPPDEALSVPFTAEQPAPARVFVSLLLRPLVCPATRRQAEKRMEVRFFAPGSLVSNLDFVERIFGNGGGPFPARRRLRRATLQRTHRLRDPGAAPAGHDETRARPAANRCGDAAAATRRHVLPRSARALQRWQCVQDYLS